jgi:hypothetical protein
MGPAERLGGPDIDHQLEGRWLSIGRWAGFALNLLKNMSLWKRFTIEERS